MPAAGKEAGMGRSGARRLAGNGGGEGATWWISGGRRRGGWGGGDPDRYGGVEGGWLRTSWVVFFICTCRWVGSGLIRVVSPDSESCAE